MKKILANAATGLLLALSLASCTEKKAAPTPAPLAPVVPELNADPRNYADYTELVWNDEFAGSAIDPAKWNYETGGSGWGNNELEYYTTAVDNSYINNGNLVIEAKRQAQGGRDYTSARMLTKGKQNFQFGRIDVRAKLPQGQGLWPAIWMLGSDIDTNNWPKCGEIDIMELRGEEPNKMLTTMHFPNSSGTHDQKGGPNQVLSNGNFSDAFHLFSVVRSKNQMRFFLDGNLYFTFSPGDVGSGGYPFNNPFFLVLNVAVGGDFVRPPTASTVFPQQMQVDYVRYYQYK
ncbi:MAG: glycoside hydrolase family 16 protein [Bacteroidota bacterium]|nr:glycoside hydrolase family 16 protein [Bacteroidota bacterium]